MRKISSMALVKAVLSLGIDESTNYPLDVRSHRQEVDEDTDRGSE